MIRSLLEWLSGAMQAAPSLALLAAFIWGILSIILSPCHLASIPLIIGFINEQGRISVAKAFRLSFMFAFGILITIGAIGAITAAMGRMMGDIGSWGNYLVAVIFFVFGLYLLDVIHLPWEGSGPRFIQKKGYLAALIMGLIFGVALGPCTFAYMAPMLGIVFSVASTQMLYAVSLLLAFGIGHCLVIVLAGTLTEEVQKYLKWTENSKAAGVLRKVCGVLVILGGLYLVYTAI